MTRSANAASSGGTWDISNADRIGKGEVQLCNILIEGAAKLVQWENKMEKGDTRPRAFRQNVVSARRLRCVGPILVVEKIVASSRAESFF